MHYPLLSVHALVYETIHPDAVVKQSDVFRADHAVWQEAIRQVKEARLLLMQQAIESPSTDSLRVTIHACQAGCISLINRLSYYITISGQTAFSKKQGSFITTQYAELQRILISHLGFLQQHFPAFFDINQLVPPAMLAGRRETLTARTEAIKCNLYEAHIDTHLIELAFTPLTQFANLTPLPTSFRQLWYHDSFLTELETHYGNSSPANHPLFLPFADFLVKMNFNEDAFIRYMMQQLRKQQDLEEMPLEEQVQAWAYHSKEFSLLPPAASPLHANRPSASDILTAMCEQELRYLQRRIQFNPAKPGNPGEKEKTHLVTFLTVSQLGVFVRLLVDCKIIQHHNQAELLRLLATSVRTVKTNSISAESLRVRYYNPDKASLAITKEYLLLMLNQLKNY